MTLRLPTILRNAIGLLVLASICAFFRANEEMVFGVLGSGLLGIANFAVWGLVGKLLVSAEETHRRWAAFLWIAKLTFFFGGLVLLLSAFPIAAVTVGVLVMLLAILIEALASPQRLIAVEEA